MIEYLQGNSQKQKEFEMKKVSKENIKQFEQNRKVVLSKVRFDNGFEDSVIALDFMNELMIWSDPNNIMIWSKINIRHVAFNVAYNYVKHYFDHMSDEQYREIMEIINRWSKEFKCAYDHSSSVNFTWAFRELLKEVKPLIERCISRN